MPPECL